jgi:hypothetical protein
MNNTARKGIQEAMRLLDRGILRRRHWLCLVAAGILVVPFLAGESSVGQRILQGKPVPNEDHFAADDRVMGAGLAPFVYCLVPAVLLMTYAGGSLAVEAVWRRLRS